MYKEETRLRELSDEQGYFKSKYPGNFNKGHFTVGYLDEFCEFLYLKKDLNLSKRVSDMYSVEICLKNFISTDKKAANCLGFFVPSIWRYLATSEN